MTELYRSYITFAMVIGGQVHYTFSAKKVQEETPTESTELYHWKPNATSDWVDTECNHNGCKTWSITSQGAELLYNHLRHEYTEPMHMQGVIPLPYPSAE